MKILLTADIHLRGADFGAPVLDELADAVSKKSPDVVVVVGDIGSPKYAARHLVLLRNAVGDRPLAVALGNHDFWLESVGHAQFSNLDQIITRFWQEPARDVGAVLLDRETLDCGDLALVGGYGHFDLGFAESGLCVQGMEVTEAIYLSGGMNGLFWNDFRFIPNCATRVKAEAAEQAAALARRLDTALERRKSVLVAVHTCPWRELNGHPRRHTEVDILSAYSGNSLIGSELERRAERIELVVCGHTHMPVRERKIHGIPALNIGADYGIFRGILYDSEHQTIQWLGLPVEVAGSAE